MTEKMAPNDSNDSGDNPLIKRLDVSNEDIKVIQGIKPHDQYVQEQELKQFDNPNLSKSEVAKDPGTFAKEIEDSLSDELDKEKIDTMNNELLRNKDKMNKIIQGDDK